MKVALFIDTFYPMIDGVIKVVDNYALRLKDKCDVTVFCPHVEGCDDSRLPYKVVRCKSIPLLKTDYEFPIPHIDPHFIHQVVSEDFDIVHIHSPFTLGMMGVEYAHIKRIPVVATLHSQYRQDAETNLNLEVARKAFMLQVMTCFNRCQECWAVNDGIRDLYLNDYGLKSPCTVQLNATNHRPVEDPEAAKAEVNAKYGLTPEDNVFLFVGRIDYMKNIDFIARALRLYKDRGGKFKMLYVGEGRDEARIKQLVSELCLEEDVIFTGRLASSSDLEKIYCRAKLFLFPSLYDANSLVQIEAACQGTPTVFLEGARTASSVTPDVNGFVSGASESQFVEKIEKIMADPAYYETVAKGAKRDLYRSWDEVVDKAFNDYQTIIENYQKQK